MSFGRANVEIALTLATLINTLSCFIKFKNASSTIPFVSSLRLHSTISTSDSAANTSASTLFTDTPNRRVCSASISP